MPLVRGEPVGWPSPGSLKEVEMRDGTGELAPDLRTEPFRCGPLGVMGDFSFDVSPVRLLLLSPPERILLRAFLRDAIGLSWTGELQLQQWKALEV